MTGLPIEWDTGSGEIAPNVWQADLYVGWFTPETSAILIDLARRHNL